MSESSEAETDESEWASLLSRAKAGDHAAMGEAFESLHDYLLLAAYRGVGDDLKAKIGASDIVQQSMLDAHRGISEFRGATKAEFRSWLAQILKRNLVDAGRRYRSSQRRDVTREKAGGTNELPSPDADRPSVMARRSESDQQLAAAVRDLPKTMRLVVEMRHRDGLSYLQIAKQLRISPTMARETWVRALAVLRKVLPDDSDS